MLTLHKALLLSSKWANVEQTANYITERADFHRKALDTLTKAGEEIKMFRDVVRTSLLLSCHGC